MEPGSQGLGRGGSPASARVRAGKLRPRVGDSPRSRGPRPERPAQVSSQKGNPRPTKPQDALKVTEPSHGA